MSFELSDLYESGVMSDCCSGRIYSESDMCAQCGEHCDAVKDDDTE